MRQLHCLPVAERNILLLTFKSLHGMTCEYFLGTVIWLQSWKNIALLW